MKEYILSFVGGIAVAVVTLLTANRAARRDDFTALLQALNADNANLRERMKAMEDEMDIMHKERDVLIKTINGLKQEIDNLRGQLKKHESKSS